HRLRIVRTDDYGIDAWWSVVQAKRAGAPHRAAVVTGQLVVVHVGRGETGGAHLAFEKAEPLAIDSLRDQPIAIVRCVRARRGKHRGWMAEQRKVVGIVAGHATSSLLEIVDQEAEVEDVRFVEKDVVPEPALEGEDVVERDRACAENHCQLSVGRLTEKEGRPAGRLVGIGLSRRRAGAPFGAELPWRPAGAR